MLLLAYGEAIDPENMLFLGSGVSYHMSRKQKLFIELDEDFRWNAGLGDSFKLHFKVNDK